MWPFITLCHIVMSQHTNRKAKVAIVSLIVFYCTGTLVYVNSSRFPAILMCYRQCTGWAKKTAHGFLCNNFAYSQPIFIIFGLYKPQEICNWKVYSQSTYHDLCNYTTLRNLDHDFTHVSTRLLPQKHRKYFYFLSD